MCGGRFLALSSKLRITIGLQTGQLESSGSHKAVEAVGSACIGVWVSGSTAAATGAGDPSLQVAQALRLAY
jgi:hypothetical protein